MIKFIFIILVVLIASFVLSFMSSEHQKQYKEPVDRLNQKIEPFYELWGYIAMAVLALLFVSKYFHKIKTTR